VTRVAQPSSGHFRELLPLVHIGTIEKGRNMLVRIIQIGGYNANLMIRDEGRGYGE
jgi:hypothetical protein